MKILSVRRGFLADHSSTSYEFLAVDKPLGSKARAAVRHLSSRVRPTARKASFVYQAEGCDIPGGWGALMVRYYDVMYSESYDWWTFAIAFNTTNKDLVSRIRKYEFRGIEGLGLDVHYHNKRLVVTVHCRMDSNQLYYYVDPNADDMWFGEKYETEANGTSGWIDDRLLDLLVRIRDRLKRGDCQALYTVWETYGFDDDDDESKKGLPRPRKTKAGSPVAEELAHLLAPM
jgi:hypothetical protein